MDREAVISDTDGTLSLGGPKQKKLITSIYELRNVMEKLMSGVQDYINRNYVYADSLHLDNFQAISNIEPLPFHINIRPEDQELVIDQLIFDILYWKYLCESPRMTLMQYSMSQRSYVWSGNNETDDNCRGEAIRKRVKAAISREIKIMNNPALRLELQSLGVNPDQYFENLCQLNKPFSKDVTKPKAVWDYLYYNTLPKSITSKQYMRSFSKNENYSHGDIVKLLNTYDSFIDIVFMQEAKNNKDYVQKSMDYFHLEIYKRFDFIYKLSVRLDSEDSPKIDKNHALVKRFHPMVFLFIDHDGEPRFTNKVNYYRPMLMLEEAWQQEGRYKDPLYFDTIMKHHLIRAKVYELFRYHLKFESEDYDDIAKFIHEHYNVLDYHAPRKEWIQESKKSKGARDMRVTKALEINEALFGASSKRDPVDWTNPNTPPSSARKGNDN